MKMYDLIGFGTIREDIIIPYDFSKPMSGYECKVKMCGRFVGGSVYNTCKYAFENESTKVLLIANNCKNDISGVISNESFAISPCFAEGNSGVPFSVIGVDDSGEKRMLSYDSVQKETSFSDEFQKLLSKTKLFYSSFYEVNENTIDFFHRTIEYCGNNKIDVMMDLCPLMSEINVDYITYILGSIQHLSGNMEEYISLCRILNMSIEEMAARFNFRAIWLKKGEQGSDVIAENGNFSYVSDKKIVAQNTTGCGDIFNATVLAGIIKEVNLSDIIKKASINGERIAMEGMPWRKA